MPISIATTKRITASTVGAPAQSWGELWMRTAVIGALIVAASFAAYEAFERVALSDAATGALHALHIVRGVTVSVLLATWAFLAIRRARTQLDRERDAHLLTLEQRVRERTADLEATRAFNEALEAQLRHGEKMASLGMLTAGFAHDLGNPLASISSELELLESEESMERVRESLGVLRRHVQRMSRTLREMVDFARRRRDAISDVSVASAVDDAARLVCHDRRWKNVSLVRDLPMDLPAVHMVEDHLVLVLVNLMINAADAMPAGGTLTVSARAAGRNIELVVRDTGVGMTREVLARAATPLFTTKGHARGTGLGLSVCTSIARSIGGDLSIDSEPGRGTGVRVRIPIAPRPSTEHSNEARA